MANYSARYLINDTWDESKSWEFDNDDDAEKAIIEKAISLCREYQEKSDKVRVLIAYMFSDSPENRHLSQPHVYKDNKDKFPAIELDESGNSIVVNCSKLEEKVKA